jgi:hypothetical protein
MTNLQARPRFVMLSQPKYMYSCLKMFDLPVKMKKCFTPEMQNQVKEEEEIA